MQLVSPISAAPLLSHLLTGTTPDSDFNRACILARYARNCARSELQGIYQNAVKARADRSYSRRVVRRCRVLCPARRPGTYRYSRLLRPDNTPPARGCASTVNVESVRLSATDSPFRRVPERIRISSLVLKRAKPPGHTLLSGAIGANAAYANRGPVSGQRHA